MVVLDFSIVNVALPSIRQALGFGGDSVQWVVTAYAITFGGLLILGGRAADILGRRRMFVAGLVVFAAASLAGGLTGDADLLVAARALQGVGAAFVAPASLSLITAHYVEGPQRTRALGLYGSTAAIGFVTGQVIGGVLVQYTTWRSIFLVNVPVGVAAALLAPLLLAHDRQRGKAIHVDVAGGILSTTSVAALVFAISEGTVLGWDHILVVGAVALAVAGLIGFVTVERARTPILWSTSACCNGPVSALPGYSPCCSGFGPLGSWWCCRSTSSRPCATPRLLPDWSSRLKGWSALLPASSACV